MRIIDRCIHFATEAHGDQKYGDRPYAAHLHEVSSLVYDYGQFFQVVAWLHDVLEDTKVIHLDLCTLFGKYVADSVALITDPPGKNRKERKAQAYARLKLTDAREWEEAFIVKVADRLSNVRACRRSNNVGLLKMYNEEHRAFKEAIYRPGEIHCEHLWNELDRLVRCALP